MKNTMNAIIVEDILLASDALKMMLSDFPEVHVISKSSTAEDAINKINHYKPDLVFMDIKLKNDSGFDVLNACAGNYKFVIFTTAYDEFSLQAYQYQTIHYILKPVDKEQLQVAISKAATLLSLNHSSPLQEELQNLNQRIQQTGSAQNFMFLYDKKIWHKVNIDEIIYGEANKSYTTVYTTRTSIVLCKNLKQFAESLQPYPSFYRVHKTYIVNINYIQNIRKGLYPKIELNNGVIIPVSPMERDTFFKLLQM